MKAVFKAAGLAVIAGSLMFAGCKKSESEDTDITSAEDQSQAEMVYDQVFKQVDEASNDQGLKKTYPIVTIDTVASPRSMTIDYGTINFLCKDGNYRRGKILVNWTGKYREKNTVINISFDNFFQNDNQVEGTKTVTNMGRNSNGQMTFTIVVDGKITLASSGGVITWTSNRTRTWISGENTPLISSDDIYEISGSNTGINRKGNAYTATITKNLRVDLGCLWRITSGTIDITPSGKPTRTVDFGNGACDRIITVTVNGKTRTFQRNK